MEIINYALSLLFKNMLNMAKINLDSVYVTTLFKEPSYKLNAFYYDKGCTKLRYEYVQYINSLAIELGKLPKVKILIIKRTKDANTKYLSALSGRKY
jgi:hypothetical protein